MPQASTFRASIILGYKFIKNVNGNPHRVEVKEQVTDTKFLVAVGDSGREEIMEYNEILDFVNKSVDPDAADPVESFEDIVDHRKIKDHKWEVLVKWTYTDDTWEPLEWMIKQDPITVARYAKDKDLLDTSG